MRICIELIITIPLYILVKIQIIYLFHFTTMTPNLVIVALWDVQLNTGGFLRHNWTSLANSFTFRVQIQAVNAIGSSPMSLPLLAKTRPLPPAPPPLECSAAGPQSLKLKWGESGGHMRTLLADDTVYTLQMEDKNHRCTRTHTLNHAHTPINNNTNNTTLS